MILRDREWARARQIEQWANNDAIQLKNQLDRRKTAFRLSPDGRLFVVSMFIQIDVMDLTKRFYYLYYVHRWIRVWWLDDFTGSMCKHLFKSSRHSFANRLFVFMCLLVRLTFFVELILILSGFLWLEMRMRMTIAYLKGDLQKRSRFIHGQVKLLILLSPTLTLI